MARAVRRHRTADPRRCTHLARLGGFSLGLILIDMIIATTVILLVGKAFGLGGKLSTLLAVGTSIGGVSAIIAGKGAIDADDEDSGYAIAAILAVSALATLGVFSKADITSLGSLSKWAFLLCFAGVGLNFDLQEMARSGIRPLVVAALGLVVVAACSLGLVLLTSGWIEAH
ncbi:putative sulfate exporter family transporter [Pseudonocardia sp. GCM10023141]|uniref:putative sulfate exporter family transporter n=1 Tax=Pseudonocardia sp. GCM10023141 TaxID=3252653 RepID=UPI0036061E42